MEIITNIVFYAIKLHNAIDQKVLSGNKVHNAETNTG